MDVHISWMPTALTWEQILPLEEWSKATASNAPFTGGSLEATTESVRTFHTARPNTVSFDIGFQTRRIPFHERYICECALQCAFSGCQQLKTLLVECGLVVSWWDVFFRSFQENNSEVIPP